MMTPRRTAFALLVSFTLVTLPAALAAHLTVLKTMPADGAVVTEPPAEVQVWFDQQPSPRVSRLDVKGPGGDVALDRIAVHAEDRSISAAVTGTLPAGAYEVTWRTAGDDGHVMRGTFTFVLKGSR
jgi:copper resistance protein C